MGREIGQDKTYTHMHKYIPKYSKTSKDYCSLWLLAILVSSSFFCHVYDQFDVKKNENAEQA